MSKKRNSNLVLGAAKPAAGPDTEETESTPQAAVDGSHADQSTPDTAAQEDDAENGQNGNGGGTLPDDDKNQYATITKTYLSGGENGKMQTRIVATYQATKDATTGAVSFDTFTLTFTDVDNNVSSSIQDYSIKNTDWTPIPAPSKPADAEKFQPAGEVKVDVKVSGKMMRVRFNMGGDNTPSDIGYIFMLDVPKDTKFAPKSSGGKTS